MHHTQPISVFYERLAGRPLTDAEQEMLDHQFHLAYRSRRERIGLSPQACEALELWHRAGDRQSSLSMHPHGQLAHLVHRNDISHFFPLIEGWSSGDPGDKSPHLIRYLTRLRINPAEALLIGDGVDDAKAALGCGVSCVLY